MFITWVASLASTCHFGLPRACLPSPPQVGVILDVTSFYSEGGGQIYDTGVLRVGAGAGAAAGAAAGDDEDEAAKTGPVVSVVNVQTFGGYAPC